LRLTTRLAVVLSALLVVGLAVVLTNVVPVRQIVAQYRQVETAEEQLTALRRENRLLEAEAKALQNPTEVERIARETLGYVDPGEVAYRVVDPEGDDPKPGADDREDTLPVEADTAWYEDVWDFVTGADLAGTAES
jgi:cell division protein FtsL